MSNELDSDARCLKAIELTFRFGLTCFVPLAFLLVGICLLFGEGYKLGMNTGFAIVVVYFIVAYRHVGRGNKTSLVIARLAGLTIAKAAAEGDCANDAGDDALLFEFNPANGMPMFNDMVDIQGNPVGTSSD